MVVHVEFDIDESQWVYGYSVFLILVTIECECEQVYLMGARKEVNHIQSAITCEHKKLGNVKKRTFTAP